MTVQVIVVIAVHPVHSRPRWRMIRILRVYPFPGRVPTNSFPHPDCLLLLPDFSVQHLVPSSLDPLFIGIDWMRRASNSPSIHSRPPTESSHIMIVKTFIIIAHGPMMIRGLFSRVWWLRSPARGEPGFNIDIFMSIAGSVRRRRGRKPAHGLFPFVFTIY